MARGNARKTSDTSREGRGVVKVKAILLPLAVGFCFLTESLSAKTFYFPHYGDGGGVSMLFSVSNLSDTPALGAMTFYDSVGAPQQLPLDPGEASQIVLSLPPNSTKVVSTHGTSIPVKTGYAKVELNQEEVSGVAIFRYASGLEASVLPVVSGKEFCLFVERSTVLDTGIAILRSTSEPIHLKIYDLGGNLIATELYDFSGHHVAKFLSEIFTLRQNFTGTLRLESETPFAPLGLRFGGGILSAIPVFDFLAFKPYFSPKGGTQKAILNAINRAQKSIDVAMYSFTVDALADALISAKDRGLAVRVMVDKGQSSGLGAKVDRLIANGVSVRKVDPPGSSLMHHKFAIFDGKTLLTGSYNWSANAEVNSYENASFIRSPELVSAYQGHFDGLWGGRVSLTR